MCPRWPFRVLQLEGEVNNVMKALVAIMSSVYGNNTPRTPTAAQQAAKSEEEAGEASGTDKHTAL